MMGLAFVYHTVKVAFVCFQHKINYYLVSYWKPISLPLGLKLTACTNPGLIKELINFPLLISHSLIVWSKLNE